MAERYTSNHLNIDFDEIEQAMKRGRVLRAHMFRSTLQGLYRSLTNRQDDGMNTEAPKHQDCLSAA